MQPADRYWRQYLATLPAAPGPYAGAFGFGFDDADAAEIAELVKAGTKTATGSLLWSYEHDGKPVPAPGDHWVVLAGGERPACIIRTTAIEILPFDEVPAIYAELGGEWDRSVAQWQRSYRRYIEVECARMGRPPSDAAPLVMERFECVYAAPCEAGA